MKMKDSVKKFFEEKGSLKVRYNSAKDAYTAYKTDVEEKGFEPAYGFSEDLKEGVMSYGGNVVDLVDEQDKTVYSFSF